MVKRMFIMLVAAGIVFGGVWFMHRMSAGFIQKYISALTSQPQTVASTTAALSDWTRSMDAVGTLRAVRGATLSLQVAGTVERIAFKSGETVATGQTLLQLDASEDRARLQALKAAAQLAEITFERDRKQFAARAVSQQTVDSDRATLAQARANVAQQQAMVDHKSLRAPFAGRLGLRQVDLGQYLKAGDPVVTLQSFTPIYVDFHLPQQALAELRVGQRITATNDTFADQTFTGTLTAITPQVDPATRTVQVRAELPNPDGKLIPGMYAAVKITTGTPQPFLTLPQTAVTYHPYGDTVFVITPDPGAATVDNGEKDGNPGKKQGDKPATPTFVVHEQFVTTGATRGDQVQILKGLKAGDVVVSAGQLKLRNGSKVVINNELQPLNNPHPTPQEQ
ncbi:MAG: efflux RND transporter periplasmic adaptor subunit [Nevskiaceae bacterium]|nr:MAG: efflux RND transporter periplasmic adaptor subunit [Nevskiaceae bacterium]TBR71950.1 MAG: efflux RND transporter periplasmic adaptor subunit [Nevskiaceae bacterium]